MDPKATRRVSLDEAMAPLAAELDRWALAREKVILKIDRRAAGEARALAGEIRFCLEQVALTDSLADGEAATKRLQLLRAKALEFLSQHR